MAAPATIGAVVGVYTGTWAILQIYTGHLTDYLGLSRKKMGHCGRYVASGSGHRRGGEQFTPHLVDSWGRSDGHWHGLTLPHTLSGG